MMRLDGRLHRLEAAALPPLSVHVLIAPDGLDDAFADWRTDGLAALSPQTRAVVVRISDEEPSDDGKI
jgi:hypothetical protein